jgi:hypothetical protein
MEFTEQPTKAPLLRWGSVFGGVVIGGALLLLLSTLWVALAAATDVDAIADGLGWFIGASAIVALFLGGWIAGALSGVPGIGPGIMNGLAVWGVIVVLSALVGTPGALTAWSAEGLELPALEPGQALWPAFWSLLVGALTAAAGGALGGLTTRGEPAIVPAGDVEDRFRDEREERERRDERRDRGEARERQPYDGPERREHERRGVGEREYATRSDDSGLREPLPPEQVPPSERAYAEQQQARNPAHRRPPD